MNPIDMIVRIVEELTPNVYIQNKLKHPLSHELSVDEIVELYYSMGLKDKDEQLKLKL